MGPAFTLPVWLLAGVVLAALAVGVAVGRQVARRRLRERARGAERENDSLRDQLQRAQRMEAVGILAGSIVHHFQNLLAVVLGHARLAMDDLDPEDGTYGNLERVIQAGQSATQLTRQILAFQRRTEQERRPLRLQPVIQETVKLLRDILPETVDLKTDVEAGCGPVLASTPQVQQVLMSLVSNAYQAMPDHRGTITIALKLVTLEESRAAIPQNLAPGTYVRLGVQDDGHGMDRETMQRIFEPYFSGQATRRGAGLGLTAVRRLVEANEGRVVPISEPGEGTRFDIHFPLIARAISAPGEPAIPAAAPSSPQAAAAAASGGADRVRPVPRDGKARILLVDDEVMVADMLEAGLARLGYRVTALTSGTLAAAAIRNQPDVYDLVISDMLMRGVTGVELAEEIQAQRPDLPVILVTGYRDSVDDDQAAAAGVRVILEKPFTHHELASAVDRVLAATRGDFGLGDGA